MQSQLVCYKQLPIWQHDTLPEPFMQQHNTQAGTWAQLTILQGSLQFAMLTEDGQVTAEYTFTPENQPPMIEPQQWHKIVSCSADIQCQLAFYCQPKDYVHKRYQFTPTHSEVLQAAELIQPGKALDLGCGSGRNALYLQLLGFDVTALDKNSAAIANLQQIIQQDQLEHIRAAEYDINSAAIAEDYDFILSTVVLMFLNPERIAAIIDNLQQHTRPGGYNLIVAAMSTADYPCPMPFSFTFQENELRNYYQGWEIIKYNEDVGQLHKTNAQGERIKLRFATLLAKKPA